MQLSDLIMGKGLERRSLMKVLRKVSKDVFLGLGCKAALYNVCAIVSVAVIDVLLLLPVRNSSLSWVVGP